MFGYNGTAECCCKEKSTCAVIQLDCPTSDRPVDYIRNQFYGRFDTDNEEWNETCDKLWYTDSAVISVDTSAIEYIDDNVGVNSFTYDIRKDTEGNIRRFSPGEWFTEINEFSVGSHTIQYIHKEKFFYSENSTFSDTSGNEANQSNIDVHCLNEVIVDGSVVFKAGTWDNIAEGCYNECKSKFLSTTENTSSEGDDEQPVNQNYENIRPNKYTHYLIRRDKWIYVYWGNILATRFYDDCTDEYINLTFSVECGGSVDYTRRIEVTPCSFQWWKPDKWWLTKEYLTYLPMDADENDVKKRMDELLVSKEEKQGCPYPECCRYISNELKEYSESIVATIKGLPAYSYNPIQPDNCKTTAKLNLGALDRQHLFKYSLCCGYEIQNKLPIIIGNATENCIGYGSSCSAYYSNTHELYGNISDFRWTVEQGIVANPVCLEAKYGEILNISFREFPNYAGVEITIEPPYGHANVNSFGDIEFQMPTSLPFGVNVVRFEYTLYDIYGTKSKSTISVQLLETPLSFVGDGILYYEANSQVNRKNLGSIIANYEREEYPIYTVAKIRKNIHSDLVRGNIEIDQYGNIFATNICVENNTGIELTEITIKDQFDNECTFRLIHIVEDSPLQNTNLLNNTVIENIITDITNGVNPSIPPSHDDYNDEYRFKKGERIHTEDVLLKIFPTAPYKLSYNPYSENRYEHIQLATVTAFSGAKGPLRISSSLYGVAKDVLLYIEGAYIYGDFTLVSSGELRFSLSVNGATTNIITYVIPYTNYDEEYYTPINVLVVHDDDNEAYDFGLVNKVSFNIELKSYWESSSGSWCNKDSATVSFILYWIVQKQAMDLQDIVNAKFVHLPTISRPRYITEYRTWNDNNHLIKVAQTGDGTHHRYWSETDSEGYFIAEHPYVDSDSSVVGRNDFFFGSNISYDNLHLDDVTVSFGVGNDVVDCFNHDEQPFNGNVIFTVLEEHIKEEERPILDSQGNIQRDNNTGADLTEIIRTVEDRKTYIIVLEPHTHEDYRLYDSDLENNANCNCPKGIQSYWFTEYGLCANSNNDKYAELQIEEDCEKFNYAIDNYYNYWNYISFSYKDGKPYISDGYRTYTYRPATVNSDCTVTPADRTVWIELYVGNYITKYTITGVLENG